MTRLVLLITGLALFGILGPVSNVGAQGTITLAWDPNSEPDIAGYVVEYGESPGQYWWKETTGNQTTLTLWRLSPGTTYYFVVRAYNETGGQSPSSNEVAGVAGYPPSPYFPPLPPDFLLTATSAALDGAPGVNGWATSDVAYHVNPANEDVPEADAVAAVRAGASAWSEQSGADIEWVFAGRTSATSVGFDSVNNVVFRPDGNGDTVASTYLFVDASGTIVDADIVFWDARIHWFTGMSGCLGGAYIQDVATREFGHALGLDHSSDARDTMYSQQAECSTLPRTLTGSDLTAIEALYPPLGVQAPRSNLIPTPNPPESGR